VNHTLIEIWAAMTTVGMGYFVYRSETYRLCLLDAENLLEKYRIERKSLLQRSKEREASLRSIFQKIGEVRAEKEAKQK
jgi:hypothetical protein